MTKQLRILWILTAGFVGGVAFVVACGNGDGLDAGHADAADCATCEPPLTSERIYVVRDTATQQITTGPLGTGFRSRASCNAGDRLLGGGCWSVTEAGPGLLDPYTMDDGKWKLLAAGPRPTVGSTMGDDNIYECVYTSDGAATAPTQVIATATCLKLSAQ